MVNPRSTTSRFQDVSNSRAALVASLLAGGVLNLRTTVGIESQIVDHDVSQVVALSNSLTLVYVLVLFTQMLFLADRARDTRNRHLRIGAVVAVNSFGLGSGLILLISAPPSDEIRLAALVVLFSCVTHVNGLICAGLMSGEKWRTAAILSLVAPVLRFLVSQGITVENSVGTYLSLGVASQTLVCVLALFCSRNPNSYTNSPSTDSVVSPKQILAMYGFAAFISFSTFGRFINESWDREIYEVGFFESRSVLTVGVVIASCYLPEIVSANRLTRRSSVALRKGTLLSSLAALLVAAILVLPRNELLEVLVLRFSEIQAAAVTITASWILVAVSLIPFLYLVALGSRLTLVVLPSAVPILIAHLTVDSPSRFAQNVLIASGVLSSSLLLPFMARSRSRTSVEPSMSNPKEAFSTGDLAVVVPSYNPGAAVAETVSEIYQACKASNIEATVIVVSDGSTDESVQILENIVEPRFRHIRLPENRGKGAALREGFRYASSEYVAFIDADGDISPSQIPGMVALAKEFQADVVFGSKWHPHSEVEVSRMRRLISRMHQVVQVALFDISISDSQVGVKVYRTDLVRTLEPFLRETRFSLDIEIFVAAVAQDRKKFLEVPVKLSRNRVSTIGILTTLQVLGDLLRIFWRYRIELTYSPERRESAQEMRR